MYTGLSPAGGGPRAESQGCPVSSLRERSPKLLQLEIERRVCTQDYFGCPDVFAWVLCFTSSFFSPVYEKKNNDDARKMQGFIRSMCLCCFNTGSSSSLSSLLSPTSLPKPANARSLLRNKALPMSATGLWELRVPPISPSQDR